MVNSWMSKMVKVCPKEKPEVEMHELMFDIVIGRIVFGRLGAVLEYHVLCFLGLLQDLLFFNV